MKRCVYPGSFDPITNGHLDIIDRASKIFDEVVVAILINVDKKGLFDIEERQKLISKAIEPYKNVKVESFNGLLIDFMRQQEASVIIKGLRTVSDFEYELQMALMNNKLDANIETFFMMTKAENSYLSSSSVKQVAKFGGSIEGLVPEEIIPDIIRKIGGK